MKLLKLLNKKFFLNFFTLIFFILCIREIQANEPVDIWNLKKEEPNIEDTTLEIKSENNKESIFKNLNQKNLSSVVQEDETLVSTKTEIAGLYDPGENGLVIDMWSNSNGDQIKNIFDRIKKIKLSEDAKEILNITMLTNSYSPKINFNEEQFLKMKSEWLIHNGDLKLIENYLVKNDVNKNNYELIEFLINDYLSRSKINESCEIFSKIQGPFENDYLSKFHIYCLINDNKRDAAQLQLDLKKELGFKDKFFEKKFNYLMGYDLKTDQKISEKSILEFHLSHKTNTNFEFQPNQNTSKAIWRYLSTSNLLDPIELIDIEDQKKIFLLEKATHEGHYTEEDLFSLYKRFQFNIDQLLNAKDSYKLLLDSSSKAILYQRILITTQPEIKLELAKTLKELFIQDGNGNAFKNELIKILKEIKEIEVPSNYTNFYEENINLNNRVLKKIKINNKVIHQSKLLNHFREAKQIKSLNKDLNELLKKVKKDKKYFFSTKDIILVESLKSDGAKVLKKYDSLYKINENDMPSDIQVLINNNESGMVLLRLVEIIGQDNLLNIGPETLFFIVNALNQLNIDPIRNRILLKILPLKV